MILGSWPPPVWCLKYPVRCTCFWEGENLETHLDKISSVGNNTNKNALRGCDNQKQQHPKNKTESCDFERKNSIFLKLKVVNSILLRAFRN